MILSQLSLRNILLTSSSITGMWTLRGIDILGPCVPGHTEPTADGSQDIKQNIGASIGKAQRQRGMVDTVVACALIRALGQPERVCASLL